MFSCILAEKARHHKSRLQSFPCFGFLINKRHYGANFDGLVDDPSASCRSGCRVVSSAGCAVFSAVQSVTAAPGQTAAVAGGRVPRVRIEMARILAPEIEWRQGICKTFPFQMRHMTW